MVFCKRCGRKHKSGDNYCSYCGAPLKLEILKMVQEHFEKHRKESVHNVLTVLVCISRIRVFARLFQHDSDVRAGQHSILY